MYAIKMLAMATMAAIPLSASAGTFTTLYTFTGGADYGQPSSQLIYENGALYGVTPAFDINGTQLGNVFKFDLTTKSLTVVYDFKGGTDGSSPNDLIYHNGMFYGTSTYGGITGCVDGDGCGTVFALDAKTGKESVLYSFADPGNGQLPQPGGLIYEGGVLYVVTKYLGNNHYGIIFAINPSTGAETTVHEFAGTDGRWPNPSLVFNNGLFYGTTQAGGPNSCPTFGYDAGCGVAFSLDPISGTESTVYAFTDGADGLWPTGNLIYHKGLFYGSTEYGGDMSCGRYGCGTFFSIDPSAGAESVLNSNTGPAQDIHGLADHGKSIYETLFGTYYYSRNMRSGQLVKFDLGSGHETVVHKFTNGADGSHPEYPLTYHGGVYYGTTTWGAHAGCLAGCGTIFQYVP